MQIDAFYLLKNKIENENIHLIMAGGVRNEGDEKRASELEGISQKYFNLRNFLIEKSKALVPLSTVMTLRPIFLASLRHESHLDLNF